MNIAFTLKKKLGLTQEESLPSKQLNYSEEEISVADSSKSADTAFYSAESTEVPNAGSGMPTFIRHRRDANGFGYI